MTKSPTRVLPEMNQIVDHGARADHGVGAGAAVDRAVGPDLDIVADDDAAKLRHFDEAIGIGGKSEPVLTDARAGIVPHPRADQAMAEARIGANPHIVAEDHAQRAAADAERLLERAMQQQGLTARAHDRILKVARTIADIEGETDLAVKHLAEAIQYRTLDRSYWS